MAANDASTRARVERTGVGIVDPILGLETFSSLLKASNVLLRPPLVAVVPFRWDRFMAYKYSSQHAPAMFEDFASVSTGPSLGPSSDLSGGAALHAKTLVDKEQILSLVNKAVCAVLGNAVEPDQPLMAAGLDSLSAVEFRNGLEKRMGVELPGTLVFDYPTPSAVAGYLEKKMVKSTHRGIAPGAQAVLPFTTDISDVTPLDGSLNMRTGRHAGSSAVAVVCEMTVRSPCNSLSSTAPVDASLLLPYTRWDIDSHSELFSGIPIRFGPTLLGIHEFDPAAFGIPDVEATLMDPQQRLLLEVTAEVLSSSQSNGGKEHLLTGTFVGLSSTDYAKVSCFPT
jgi:acyl carrier protein